MRIIDFHTHLQDHWLANPLLDESEFIASLDRCGVEAACVFTLQGFYGDCATENDRLASSAKAHPKRLIPFVTVDPKQGDEAVAELERCLSNRIFRGVKFHPWLQAFAPSMVRETMIQLLQCTARYDVPVLFHDGTPPYSSTFQIAAMARWVPEAKIVLGHAGLGDYVYAAGQLLRELPNLYACFCCPKAGELPYLIEMAGADRILFGSDIGIADWHMLAERLDEVTQSELPETIQKKVLYDNAARLLQLRERPLC